LVVALQPAGIRVEAHGCPISESAFGFSAAGREHPEIDGTRVSLDSAVARAARILSQAEMPLMTGMGTDVDGARAALQLAERIGAALDHMNGASLRRNTRVLQDSGWITTTLSEVKNRADLLLCVGTNAAAGFPRFFERLVATQDAMFLPKPAARKVIMLGGDASGLPESLQPHFQFIPCPHDALTDAISVLRCIVRNRAVPELPVAGIEFEILRDLGARLKAARYGVIVWAAGQLDFPHADLTVESLAELIKDLNRTTRCAGLPLGGRDGDLTVNQVATWQTGYPLPLSFARGFPEHDPYRYDGERMLANGAADALLWVSTFDATTRQPPRTAIPTVVLARPGANLSTAPEVFIPVATPGLDHAGHIFRCDGVVVLPLRALRATDLPSAAHVLGAIEKQLPPEAGAA
jgi:formylmethanofuran dehydrogenase subunit B